jgi:hypothetical protein
VRFYLLILRSRMMLREAGAGVKQWVCQPYPRYQLQKSLVRGRQPDVADNVTIDWRAIGGAVHDGNRRLEECFRK